MDQTTEVAVAWAHNVSGCSSDYSYSAWCIDHEVPSRLGYNLIDLLNRNPRQIVDVYLVQDFRIPGRFRVQVSKDE